MIPHSSVIESLSMTGIAKNVVKFLGKTMKSWRVELNYGAETLGEVPIKRGTFQGDALSLVLLVIVLIPLTHILRTANHGYKFEAGETINYLLFMDDLKLYSKSERALDSLIQTIRIFSEDIGIQFEIDKFAMLVMKKRKIVKSGSTEFSNVKVIK